MNQDDTKKYEEFVSLHDALFKIQEKLKEAQMQYATKVKKHLRDDEDGEPIEEKSKFVKEIDKMYTADSLTYWEVVSALSNRVSDEAGDDFKNAIFSMFKKIFVNMKGRTQELPLEIAKYKVTVGKCGFGYRWNVQTQELSYSDKMFELISHREEVIDALRKVKMDDWAKKFKKFCDCLPQMYVGTQVDIELKTPVRFPTREETPQARFGKFVEISGGNIRVREAHERRWRDNFDVYPDYEVPAFTYFELHKQVKAIHDEFVQWAEQVLKQSKETLDRLKEQFGKELLFAEL